MTRRKQKILNVLELKAKKEMSEIAIIFKGLSDRLSTTKNLGLSLKSQADHYRDFDNIHDIRTMRSQSITVQLLLTELETCNRTIGWLEEERHSVQSRLILLENKITKIKDKKKSLSI
jgi:hypothetical protein